ncbi:MAG: response regulator [Ignavibacteriales bacterium]|nr:MAG: response regulator [Ignavibacteriales bacterium]
MRLIVVDDERDMKLLFEQKFRKELRRGEIQIHYAFDGHSALQLINKIENPESYLILSDINMPEMNGIELLKKIKERYPKLKVIMITAYGDEQNVSAAKKYGAEEYFIKPLEFDSLKEKLNLLGAA